MQLDVIDNLVGILSVCLQEECYADADDIRS